MDMTMDGTQDTQKLSFRAGYAAYQTYKKMSDNPHAGDGRLWDEWEEGFIEARAVDEGGN